MYKEHYAFRKPDNEHVKIWNYMDFTEFVSALERKAIFFSVLSKFEDKFEGSITQTDLEERVSMVNYLKTVYSDCSSEKVLAKERKLRKDLRSLVCVSSWHVNEFESAAMWKMHLRNNEGVAFQSTFKLLTDSFSCYEKNDVYVGMIDYIDYSKYRMVTDHFIGPIMHKRLSFKCENELRAVISTIPIDKPEFQAFTYRKYRSGIHVPVNLEKLVEKIYVSPTAKKWVLETVKLATKKFISQEFSERVDMSDLTKKPLS